MSDQGTQEWLNERLGKFTASRVYDLMPGSKGAYLSSRKNYIAEKVIERMTGQSGEKGFTNASMEWGTETEPLARAAYEVLLDGEWVELSGFVEHPEYPFLGASPDGLVGDDGSIEIKCPNTATHIQTISTGDIDRKYWYQMQTVMLCAGRAWCDFISFDPRLPENCQLFVKRVERDSAAQTRILNEVMRADRETNEIIVTLSKYKTGGF